MVIKLYGVGELGKSFLIAAPVRARASLTLAALTLISHHHLVRFKSGYRHAFRVSYSIQENLLKFKCSLYGTAWHALI